MEQFDLGADEARTYLLGRARSDFLDAGSTISRLPRSSLAIAS
jgi:hypothetical protein